MPSRKYSLEKGDPQRLKVSWKLFKKDIEIRLDGAEVYSFANKRELEEGRFIKKYVIPMSEKRLFCC